MKISFARTQPAKERFATKLAIMKIITSGLMIVVLTSGAILCKAQSSLPPTAVTAAFAKLFPDAQKASWNEKINNYTVFFLIKDRKCEAKFDKEGSWMSTEQALPLDSLPRQINDAFNHSSYADWHLAASYDLSSPGVPIQYHLVITKSDLGRRILFFSNDGKLLADH
jgi:hypothetical protein